MVITNFLREPLARIDEKTFLKIGQFSISVKVWPRELSPAFASGSSKISQEDDIDQKQNMFYGYVDVESLDDMLTPLFLYSKGEDKYVEAVYKSKVGIIVLEFRFFLKVEECDFFIDSDDKINLNLDLAELYKSGYVRNI